uniref:Uncharacterized protein n=1 Tax=Arundo donax TaxID=35708 RepID=A0A0A9GZB8_ARUDO
MFENFPFYSSVSLCNASILMCCSAGFDLFCNTQW